jgi:hypothetical protein
VPTLRHTLEVDASSQRAYRAWLRAGQERGDWEGQLVEDLPGFRVGWADPERSSSLTVAIEPRGERTAAVTVVVVHGDADAAGARLRGELERFGAALEATPEEGASALTPDPSGSGMRGKLGGAEPAEAEERWPGPTPPEAGAPVAPDNRPAGPSPPP